MLLQFDLGHRLHDLEVRGGPDKIITRLVDTKIPDTHNSLCGRYGGPGRWKENVTVTCYTPIKAIYVTLQIGRECESGKTCDESVGTIQWLEVLFYGKGKPHLILIITNYKIIIY